jgi:hypothetical protein
MKRKINFDRDGLTLVGNLFTPTDFDEKRRCNAAIVEGAFTSAITAPTMIVHSDGCAFPDEANKVYSELRGEKELVWADGTHFD